MELKSNVRGEKNMEEKIFLVDSEGIIFKCDIEEVFEEEEDDEEEEDTSFVMKVYLTNYRIIFVYDDTEMESWMLNKINMIGLLSEEDVLEDDDFNYVGDGEYGVSFKTESENQRVWFYSEKAQIEFYKELTRLVLEM